jgi:hypothetical protein
VNGSEAVINPVKSTGLKILASPSQNGNAGGFGAKDSPDGNTRLPGESRHLSTHANQAERGKPVSLPAMASQP